MNKSAFSLSAWITVSIAYAASYSMTNGFFEPLQNILAPNLPSNISLMFIPHGVRILTFYFFGPLGYLYLAPVSWLMWALEVYGQQHIGFLPIGILFSLISCHIGVEVGRRVFVLKNSVATFTFNWKQLLAAGVIGSLLNSTSLTLLYNSGFDSLTFVGYLFGDVAGQFLLMLSLVVFFKLARAFSDL